MTHFSLHDALPNLNTLAFFAAKPIPLGVGPNGPILSNAYFGPVAAAIIPDGPNGQLCTSLAEESGSGSFGGNKISSDQSLQFDRSTQYNRRWSAEAIFSRPLPRRPTGSRAGKGCASTCRYRG